MAHTTNQGGFGLLAKKCLLLFTLAMSGSLSSRGQVWTAAGPADDNWPTLNSGNWPSVTADPTGNVYIAFPNEASKLTVRKWDGAAWTFVGSPNVTANTISDPAIKTDSSGTPYVAYSSGQIIVKKFQNGSWIDAGAPAISISSGGRPKLAIDNGSNLYVAYTDNAFGGKLTVRKYSGGVWTDVGPAGLTPNGCIYFDLAVNSLGIPYIAYQDGSVGNKMTVKKFTGGSWNTVGVQGFSLSGVFDVSLTFDTTNNPVTAYSDYGNGTSVTVKAFDGNAWASLGTLPSSVFGYCEYNKIICQGSKYYLLYKSYTAGNKPNLLKYEDTTWTLAGPSYFSAGSIYAADMAIKNADTPVVIYTDNAMLGKLSVKKLADSAWIYLGTPGISLGSTTYNAAVVNGQGVLYSAFCEYVNSNVVSLRKFANNTWSTVDSAATPYNAAFLNLAVGKADTLYFTFQDYVSSKAKTKKYAGGVWLTLPDMTPLATTGAYMAMDTAKKPCVLYGDNANAGKLTARRYSGGSWQAMGAPITQYSVNQISFRIGKDNVPYVAYVDGNYSFAPVVQKFDGTNWSYVGTPGLTNGQSNSLCLEIDSAGKPWVAFFDAAFTGKITVKKFTGSAWITVGSPGFSQGPAFYINLIFDKFGIPYVAYQDLGFSDKVVVKRFDGSAWVDAGAAALSPSKGIEIKLANDKNNNNSFLIYSNGQNYAKQTNFTLCTPAALSFTKSNVTCNGLTNGTVDLTASGGTGPFSYAWTGPGNFSSSGQDISGLAAGSYHVTVSTAVYGGCSSGLNVTVDQPPVLTANSGNNVPCPGNDLQFTATASGGTPPYSFGWSGPNGYLANGVNPSIAHSSDGLNGDYIVHVTDSNSCGSDDTVLVTILPAPSQQATGLNLTALTANSVKLNFNRGNGNKGVIVLASEGNPANAIPVCGNSYQAPASATIFFNGDSLLSIIGNAKVVYKSTAAAPAAKTFTLKGLQQGTRYYFSAFEYDSSAAGTVYLTYPRLNRDTVTLIAAPNIAAKNLRWEQVSPHSAKLRWTNGNGSGRIVIMKAVNAINGAPADSSLFTAGSSFGQGDSLVAQLPYTGTNYVVYNGSDSSVTVDNLQSGIKYNVAVFEYNGYGSYLDYAATSLKGSMTTLPDFIAIGTTGIPHEEHFDTLLVNANMLPSGWHVSAGITADNGASAVTGIKNYGTTGGGDRALGSLGGNSLGVKLVNKGKVPWTSMLIKYTGEQWREGGGGIADTLSVQYSLNAYTFTGSNAYLSPSSAIWADAPVNLMFLSPQTGGAAASLDGNAAANRADRIASITGINILPGEAIWLRWQDRNANVNDGLAVDDVEIVPFSNTLTAGGTLADASLADLNVTGGTALLDPSAGKLTVKNALNIESGAVLDMGTTVAPAITMGGWLYGSGYIKAPAANDAKITAGGAGINHTMYFQPGNNTVNSLTVQGNSQVTLGNTLNIAATPKAGMVKIGTASADALLNTNGHLVLKSDTLATAMIDDVYGSVNGNVTIERALQQRPGIRLVAHPFSTPMSLASVSGYLPPLGNLWYYDAATASPNGVSELADNSVWTLFPSLNTAAAPYSVLRLMKDTTQGAFMSLSGLVNQGPVMITNAAASDSFVIVGNPYPSGVSLANALADAGPNFINSAIYTWDPSKNISGAFVPVPNVKFASAKLPICGAFVALVHPGTTASFSFSEADKVATGNTKTSFRPRDREEETTATPPLPPGLQLTIEKNDQYYDALYLYFKEDAQSAADQDADAPKLNNPGLNFYTTTPEGRQLSVDTRPFENGKRISLGLANAESGHYTIRVSDFVMEAGRELVLADTYTGRETVLASSASYAFNVDKDLRSKNAGRFYIRMGREDHSIENQGFAIQLVPNPAKDRTTIIWSGAHQGPATIKIMSATGQQVFDRALSPESNKEIEVSLTKLPAGIYMIEITCNGEKVTRRLVKQ